MALWVLNSLSVPRLRRCFRAQDSFWYSSTPHNNFITWLYASRYFFVFSISSKFTQTFHNPTKVIWSVHQACNLLIPWLDMHKTSVLLKWTLLWPLDCFPLNKAPRHMWMELVLGLLWPAAHCTFALQDFQGYGSPSFVIRSLWFIPRCILWATIPRWKVFHPWSQCDLSTELRGRGVFFFFLIISFYEFCSFVVLATRIIILSVCVYIFFGEYFITNLSQESLSHDALIAPQRPSFVYASLFGRNVSMI